jgi:hypothetical protein
LAGLWYLLLAAGGIGLLTMIVILARGGHVRAEIPVAFQEQAPNGAADSTSAASLTDLTGTLKVPVSATVAAVILGFVVIELGWALFALRQLRLLLTDVLAGSAFAPQNARRVGLLGVTIVGAELVRALAVFVGSWWARGHADHPHVAFQITFPLQPGALAAGVLVMVLAGVFRLGRALQEDQDLTI